MNDSLSNRNNHLKPAATRPFRFRKVDAAALIAIVAIMMGSIPPAEAQDESLKAVTVDNARNMRFGEIIIVIGDTLEIYSTTGLNDCPPKLWDTMDLDKLAKEYGAVRVQKNGPKFWMMDSQSLKMGEKASFGGIDARFAAKIPAGLMGKEGADPSKIFQPKKTQKMVYKKGKPVFELVDPDGHAYVLEAHAEEFPISSLATLGDKMKQLPAGWKYRTRVLTEDLVMDLTPDETIYAVGDEFHQYYTRIPATE